MAENLITDVLQWLLQSLNGQQTVPHFLSSVFVKNRRFWIRGPAVDPNWSVDFCRRRGAGAFPWYPCLGSPVFLCSPAVFLPPPLHLLSSTTPPPHTHTHTHTHTCSSSKPNDPPACTALKDQLLHRLSAVFQPASASCAVLCCPAQPSLGPLGSVDLQPCESIPCSSSAHCLKPRSCLLGPRPCLSVCTVSSVTSP